MGSQQLGVRPRYNVDLADLHSVCEANYVRVLRLFPDYERCNQRAFVAGSNAQASHITLEVTERSRYTTMLRLTQLSAVAVPRSALKLDLRLYHDARMAEVVAFQSQRSTAGRYPYPNPNMLQRDEKRQQNAYLAELLAFCLAEGLEPSASQFLDQP